jgi:hypothetical protein
MSSEKLNSPRYVQESKHLWEGHYRFRELEQNLI